MFRQVYLTEEGSSLSYQMDLHERSAEDMNQSVDTMSIADLQTLWGYRYAGDVGTDRLFQQLNVSQFTRFLRDPFSLQPSDSRTRFFREDARAR